MGETPTETKITVATLLTDLRYIRDRIDSLCTDSRVQDKRLDNVERVTWAVSSVAGVIVAILVPIAVAAIKKWLSI